MAREDLHFRLRLPEDLKARIEASAQRRGISMTAEIVGRLNDSYEGAAIVIPGSLRQRIEVAAKANGRDFPTELWTSLLALYPEPAPQMSPETFYQVAVSLIGDTTTEEGQAELKSLIERIRRATGNPNWAPPERGVSRYFDTWEGRDLLRQKSRGEK